MAELPPRKNLTPTKLAKCMLSPLQTLLQMGFPRNRAEKALAATGFKSVQLASDWLLAHVNDDTLDDPQPREYLLYLCPTDSLQYQLQTFCSKSHAECGRNGAHDFIPHVTLSTFFKVPDDDVGSIIELMEKVIKNERLTIPEDLELETYVSPNFMGFFLGQDSAKAIKALTATFVKELASRDISADVYNQDLHMTLAYNFGANQYSTLETLVNNINPDMRSNWQFRLYSRDVRLSGRKVYKVIYPHVPRETDELELLMGDFIYIDPEAWNNSIDGWVQGISWLTGCSGFLPKNYVEKTAETDAWTLHKSVKLYPSKSFDVSNGVRDMSIAHPDKRGAAAGDKAEALRRGNSSDAVRDECVIMGRPLTPRNGSRRIFIVRHGERVDFTFGTWIPYCFDETGKYMRKDLNMPVSVPKRHGSPESFFKDSPITSGGEMMARFLGEALVDANQTLGHVYCSPSLRCVQTANGILKGLGVQDKTPITIEPGLFEWLAWYQDSMPTFMTPTELEEAGFRLRRDHQPIIDFSELRDRKESSEQYYARSLYVTQCILRLTAHIGGNILLVGHASTLDACSRQLTGGSPRNAQEFSRLVQRVPYCGLAVVDKTEAVESNPATAPAATATNPATVPSRPQWQLMEPPVPPMTLSANMRFDWQILQS